MTRRIIDADGHLMLLKSISILPRQWSAAKAIGNGNASAGLRKLIDAAPFWDLKRKGSKSDGT